MAIRSKENYLGAWGFLVGIILALAVGIFSAKIGELEGTITGVLVILGLVVGFINVSPKDQNTFLMTAVSLVIVSFAGAAGISEIEFLNIGIGKMVSSTLGALLVMLVPATIVIAIKSLFSISQR